MPETLIKVRGVNKTFNLGKVIVHALKDINVDIFRGEYLSIMGPSGSGKSTLFNMIGALDTPTSGSVEVAGINLTQLSARQLAHFRGHHLTTVDPRLEGGDNPVFLLELGSHEFQTLGKVLKTAYRSGLFAARGHFPGSGPQSYP